MQKVEMARWYALLFFFFTAIGEEYLDVIFLQGVLKVLCDLLQKLG